MTIRAKIVLTCLIAVFLPLAALSKYAVVFFDRFTRHALEQEMVHCAVVVSDDYKLLRRNLLPEPDFIARLGAFAEEFQLRLTLLSDEGRALYASDAAVPPNEDYSPLPEVQKALAGQYGARTELTTDRKYVYYLVALPVIENGRTVAVVYAARHTSPIIQAIKGLKSRLRLAMVVALAGAGVLAVFLAQTISRRLRHLATAAADFARGDRSSIPATGGHDEIARLGEVLSDMANELNRKNAYNRDFLAATAHELKTPLTAIHGAADVLADGAAAKPETRDKFLHNIRFESERLIRMVNQLTELTRLDTEPLRGKKERLDYAVFLKEIFQRLEKSFPPDHANLSLTVADDIGSIAIVPGRIEQVLINLIENALRYTPPAGQVTVEARREGNILTTLVRDTGCGIVPTNLPRVFDRFFTTEPKDRVANYGSGLGLAIAKSIVENHGGAIRVESRPGEGAVFTFSLPAIS